MADERNEWLSRDAAERLLCGERLGDVGDHAREQAELLAQSLASLTPRDLLQAGEMPGEEAALAAFRKARISPLVTGSAVAHDRLGRRIGGTAGSLRWGRPLRYGFAAALAACMIGGVAAAGAGVLPSPFEEPHPSPASTVSNEPGPTNEAPLASQPPGSHEEGDGTSSQDPSTSGSPSASAPGDGASRGGSSSGEAEARGDRKVPAIPSREMPERPQGNDKNWWERAVKACRDYRDDKLPDDQRTALEEAAKGADRLERYCKGVLDQAEGRDPNHGKAGDGKPGSGDGGVVLPSTPTDGGGGGGAGGGSVPGDPDGATSTPSQGTSPEPTPSSTTLPTEPTPSPSASASS